MSRDRVLTGVSHAALKPQPEVEMRAVLTVTHHALDAADAAELLEMLGLIKPSEGRRQDQDCPTRAAHRRLGSRRSPGKHVGTTRAPGRRG